MKFFIDWFYKLSLADICLLALLLIYIFIVSWYVNIKPFSNVSSGKQATKKSATPNQDLKEDSKQETTSNQDLKEDDKQEAIPNQDLKEDNKIKLPDV